MVTKEQMKKQDKVQGIIKNYLGETYRDMGCPDVDSECEYNAFVLREHLDDVLGFIEFAKKNDIDDMDIRNDYKRIMKNNHICLTAIWKQKTHP